MSARRADVTAAETVFHVKHDRRTTPATCAARPGRPARRLLPLLAALVALLAIGCATISSPDGWAGPVGDGDLLIIHENDGQLAALELNEGSPPRVLWRFPADNDDLSFDGIYAQPILDGERLYVFGFEGIAVALDISGPLPRQIWAAPLELEADVVATPILAGSQLYVATDQGEVVTIDADTGQVLNRLPLGDSRIWSSAMLEGGTLYVASLDDRSLRAIVPGLNASVRWERDTAGAVRADLALLGELLLVGTFDGTLHAYDIDNEGAERWSFEGDGGWLFAPTLPAGDRVYAVTMRGGVYSLDRNGDEIWSQVLEDSEFRVQPIIASQVLIVADRNGKLSGLDLADGRTVWTQELDGAQFDAAPLVVDSRVIYVTTKGEIVSVDPSNGVISRFELGG